MRRVVQFTLLSVFLCSPNLSAQDIQPALDTFNETMGTAKLDVIKGYRNLLQEALEKSEQARANNLRKFLDDFESEGALRLSSGSKPFMLKYLKARQDASVLLKSEFAKATKIANEQNDFSTSDDLTRRLAELRLGGETISYKVPRGNSHVLHSGWVLSSKYPNTDYWRLLSTWEEVSGLSNPSWVSIRPVHWPNRYVDHFGYRVRVVKYLDDNAWKKHATWLRKPALNKSRTGISFQSASHTDRFMRVRDNGEIWLDKFENTTKFRIQATFFPKDGLFFK